MEILLLILILFCSAFINGPRYTAQVYRHHGQAQAVSATVHPPTNALFLMLAIIWAQRMLGACNSSSLFMLSTRTSSRLEQALKMTQQFCDLNVAQGRPHRRYICTRGDVGVAFFLNWLRSSLVWWCPSNPACAWIFREFFFT